MLLFLFLEYNGAFVYSIFLYFGCIFQDTLLIDSMANLLANKFLHISGKP